MLINLFSAPCKHLCTLFTRKLMCPTGEETQQIFVPIRFVIWKYAYSTEISCWEMQAWICLRCVQGRVYASSACTCGRLRRLQSSVRVLLPRCAPAEAGDVQQAWFLLHVHSSCCSCCPVFSAVLSFLEQKDSQALLTTAGEDATCAFCPFKTIVNVPGVTGTSCITVCWGFPLCKIRRRLGSNGKFRLYSKNQFNVNWVVER